MDILPSGNIFRELQDIHDTGYFSAQPSLEDHWQQTSTSHLNPLMAMRRICDPKTRLLSNSVATFPTKRTDCAEWQRTGILVGAPSSFRQVSDVLLPATISRAEIQIWI
ncbi:Krueppel-like factor 7 [Belonocnema kinseyi]|uniref:Krueppel-like factor 7 n=1 Tax=Belonocnema kinseyi TaxID=2817044 RepID=UPI00143D7BB3|nr:Krueppel-like factor 7 [Belonocnema kinseyi]